MWAGRLAARFGTTVLRQLCLLFGALSVAGLALVQNYAVWVALRLFLGVALTVVFVLGESWINQLAVEKWRGRLVALYGTGYALSQLSGPLLLMANSMPEPSCRYRPCCHRVVPCIRSG